MSAATRPRGMTTTVSDRRVAKRLPQRQVVHARKAEAQLDAVLLEPVDDQTRATWHGAQSVSVVDPRGDR